MGGRPSVATTGRTTYDGTFAMVTLGGVKVHVLSDGAFALDGGAMFGVVPRVVWEKTDPPDEKNRVALGLNVALLESGGKRILVDTGMGDKWGEKEKLAFQQECQEAVDRYWTAGCIFQCSRHGWTDVTAMPTFKLKFTANRSEANYYLTAEKDFVPYDDENPMKAKCNAGIVPQQILKNDLDVTTTGFFQAFSLRTLNLPIKATATVNSEEQRIKKVLQDATHKPSEIRFAAGTDTFGAKLKKRCDLVLQIPRGRADIFSMRTATLAFLEILLVGIATQRPYETIASPTDPIARRPRQERRGVRYTSTAALRRSIFLATKPRNSVC